MVYGDDLLTTYILTYLLQVNIHAYLSTYLPSMSKRLGCVPLCMSSDGVLCITFIYVCSEAEKYTT
ncbi:hypothetical protein F4819DRAFT_471358 [Hypoxylon fuscum]|nr:hypothetical protein F4819DRAFT_471358 [Hypoxylon fuscum]